MISSVEAAVMAMRYALACLVHCPRVMEPTRIMTQDERNAMPKARNERTREERTVQTLADVIEGGGYDLISEIEG